VLAGLFLGSITWWICLSSLTTLLRTRISPLAMGIIDKVIVVMLLSFSAEAAARAMGVLA
jgi:arginine exporter protein ArgO